MRLLLLMTFIAFFNSAICQTKEETQDWISEKIELYAFSNDYDVFNIYTITFSGPEMIIRNQNRVITNGSELNLTMTYWVPIRDLSKIRFEEKKNNTWLILQTKGNIASIKYTPDSSGRITQTSSISVLLEKSIDEENLKGRLSSAFNHLISLYGGTVVEEKF